MVSTYYYLTRLHDYISSLPNFFSTSHLSHQSQSSFSHVLTYLYHYCSCTNILGPIPNCPTLNAPDSHYPSHLTIVISVLSSKSCFAVPNYLLLPNFLRLHTTHILYCLSSQTCIQSRPQVGLDCQTRRIE